MLGLELLTKSGKDLLKRRIDVLLPELIIGDVFVFMPVRPEICDDAILQTRICRRLLRRLAPDKTYRFVRTDGAALKGRFGELFAMLEFHQLSNVDAHGVLNERPVRTSESPTRNI